MFVVCSLPRTGSEAVMKAIAAAGKTICKSEPFGHTQHRLFRNKMNINAYDHVGLAKKLFKEYDGFKIIVHTTMQLREICDENNAGLILIRRNDYLATLASLIIFTNGNDDRYYEAGPLTQRGYNWQTSDSYETWTSTSRKTVYDPNEASWLNSQINKIFYANYLIDNIFPTYSNYVTTINYENPAPGLKDLKEYFGMEIPLMLAPSRPLSDYFVNHEEFKSDIEDRIKNEINSVQDE